MHEEHSRLFQENIAPYQHLFKSIRIATVACPYRSAWVSLLGRITLQTSPPVERLQISEESVFLGQLIELPFELFSALLKSITINRCVSLSDAPQGDRFGLSPVFLDMEAASPDTTQGPRVSWLGVHRWETRRTEIEFGIRSPSTYLIGTGQSVRDLAPDGDLRRIDSLLSLKHGVQSLRALCARWMPGNLGRLGDGVCFQIVAPVPVGLLQIAPKIVEIRLQRESLMVESYAVSHFNPGDEVTRQRLGNDGTTLEPRTGTVTIALPVEWPAGAESATVVVACGDVEMDRLEIWRWPGAANLRTAVDAFFDPRHEKLLTLLTSSKRKDASEFELAVVRLMNLLGVPMIWYGKGAGERRPDGAACLMQRFHKKVVIVAECTVEKPILKFSGLRERADELGEFLEGDVEVRPVVFAGCDVGDLEIRHASELGISLIGKQRLQRLCDLLGHAETNPDDVLDLVLDAR